MVEHDVQLTGATIAGKTNQSPVLVDRRDPNFLAALFREYQDWPAQRDLKGHLVPSGDHFPPAQLYQPVQRVHYFALMEASCVRPGSPRVDHSKIDSAGIVIRRVRATNGGALEGWLRDANGNAEWVPLNTPQQDLDPDASRRPQPHSGQSCLDKLLSETLNADSRSEAVSPAFAAPPEVCAATGKTLIYGLLPLASSELSKSPTPLSISDDKLRGYLPVLIRAGNKIVPLSGKYVTADYASEDYLNAQTSLSDQDRNGFKAFLALLNSATDFGVFEEHGSNESATLHSQLNELSVTFISQAQKEQTTRTQPLADFLAAAKKVLIDCDPTAASSIQMPTAWPQVTQTQDDSFLHAVKAIVRKRLADLGKQSAGELRGTGRFHDPNRIYHARAFIRVKCEQGCPPKIVWSAPSGYFRIAPWYDGPGIPAPAVVLPDLTDRNALKKLKPNVTFGVPANIFNAVQGVSLDGLTKGKKGGGGGLNLDWICGFNIPIITICAFFVLNIFLSLLNIIFFWLPLVKICIPIPKGTLNSDNS